MKNKRQMVRIPKFYVKVPQKALHLGLSSKAFALLVLLLDCAEDFNPSLSWLEGRLALSRASLTRSFRELSDHAVIKLVKRGQGRKASEWEFLPPALWSIRRRSNKRSVLRNKYMDKGQLKTTFKERITKRLACPENKHVDFIIPIIHDNVCGLNVPWNMDYYTYEEICKKGESFDGTSENNSWRR